MGLEPEYTEDNTLLDEEEKMGLSIPTISDYAELNEFEQNNIEQAFQWIKTRLLSSDEIFTESFVSQLHSKMMGEVWKWAGKFRTSNKNLGIDYWKVPVELRKLLDDARLRVLDNSASGDEVAIWFKHRIVSIHCFPNGNERHSRLIADVIIEKIYSRPVFTWGATNLSKSGVKKLEYIQALIAADTGDIIPLLKFARS